MLALETGEELDARYRIVRELGRGGVGIVYEAVRVADGLRCALKIAHGESDLTVQRGRLQLEAEIGRQLAGEHVVTIYEHGAATDRPELYYVAMELLQGVDLGVLVEQNGPLPAEQVQLVLGQLGEVLTRAHALGIVHRDLKPANLFWHQPSDGAATLKVLDFGLVKQLEQSLTATTRLTATGAIVGTPDFMAPEQASQSHLVGPHTDVWAVGMVAVFLLTGERYWRVGTLVHILTQLNAGPTYAPSSRWPHLSPAFDEWFWRSCDRLGARRYASVAAQLSALARVLPTLRAAARPRSLAGLAEDHTVSIYPAQLRALPRARAALLGRTEELRLLHALLQAREHRLVTLLGVGGTGKTRLAIEAAAEAASLIKDGVFFVELAGVRHDDALPGALQTGLGVVVEPGESALAAVARFLQPLSCLVVLDNVEHLASLPTVMERLLAGAPGVQWLVTSRQPLGLASEERVEVAPLPVPPAGRDVGEAQLRAYASALLFEQRAAEASPGWELRDEDAPAIAEILRRLDGLPLAIELAAARVRLFSPSELRERLSRRLGLLTGGRRATSERHATMRAAIDWSYDLLEPAEQRAFRALSFFPGGATLQTLADVLADDPETLSSVVEAVADQSLCRIGTDRRIGQLEVVREYGRDRASPTECEAFSAGLVRVFVNLAERAEPELRGPHQLLWLERFDREQDNLRAVLEHAITRGDGEVALLLSTTLSWYWYLRGQYAEGRRWLEQAIELGAEQPMALQRARRSLGELAYLQCDYETARQHLDASEELARRYGDLAAAADATQALGSIARERGDYEQSLLLHRRALAVYETALDPLKAARAHNYLAFAAWLSGDFGEARRHALRAEVEFAQLADEEGAIWALLNLGTIDYWQGSLEAARTRINAAHQRSRTAGFKEGVAWTLNVLGWIALDELQRDEAKETLQESLAVHRELGDLWRSASVLEALAALASSCADSRRCAKLLGVASALRRRIGTPVPRCEQPRIEELRANCRHALGPHFALLHESGAALALDAAFRFALV